MLSLVVKTTTIANFIKVFFSQMPFPVTGPIIGPIIGPVIDGGMAKSLLDSVIVFLSLFVPF